MNQKKRIRRKRPNLQRFFGQKDIHFGVPKIQKYFIIHFFASASRARNRFFWIFNRRILEKNHCCYVVTGHISKFTKHQREEHYEEDFKLTRPKYCVINVNFFPSSSISPVLYIVKTQIQPTTQLN